MGLTNRNRLDRDRQRERPVRPWRAGIVTAAVFALVHGVSHAQDGSKAVYRCPGPPVLYTDAINAQDAKERGCRTIEGTPITIVPASRVRPSAATSGASAPRAADMRVDPADQRARDNDRRRILSDELRREEERLAALRRDFNNGEPDRQGDERNYQRYLERVAEMKAAIQRKEGDVAAIRRELAQLPQ